MVTIDKKLLLKYAPQNMGEQVHVDHQGCEAGFDSKRRLYIKRVPGGILGFCHHCNGHGFVRSKGAEGSSLSRWLTGKDIDVPVVTRNIDLSTTYPLSPQGMAWISKYYLSEIDNIHSDMYGNVVLPILDPDGTKTGQQIRNLTGTGPKYITKYLCGTPNDAAWFLKDSDTLTITEDWLSARRIYRDTHTSSMALLKTTMSNATIMQLMSLSHIKKIHVWLDPDRAGRKGSKVLSARLQFLFKDKQIREMLVDKEPKEMSSSDLNSLLRGT